MSGGGGDHTDYVAFLRRVLRALSKRVGEADPEDLAEMVELRGEVDKAIAEAVAGMRARGVPWSDIGRATGMTRQSAHERWASGAA